MGKVEEKTNRKGKGQRDREIIIQEKGQKKEKSKTGTKEYKQGQRYGTWKLGVWNVRSLNGKEDELIYEFERAGLEVLVVAETKKKGEGEVKLMNGHTLVYSGVPENKRAVEGVGCIINKKLVKNIVKWKGWSERILSIELLIDKEKITIVAVYGPNENDKKEVKDKFWEELSRVTEASMGQVFVAGDFNSRVGVRKDETEFVLGKHGEVVRNSNGDRMIDYCIINNLVIMNTFFEHKNVHKFTREVHGRKEKSIIDYILTEKQNRKVVKNVRVRRGAEIYSDHHLLVGEIKITKQLHEEEEQNKGLKPKEIIKVYRLQEPEIASKYEIYVNIEIENNKEEWEQMSVEEMWQKFKSIILGAAGKACGVNKANKRGRRTAWWSKEIKQQVKIKKERWAEYLVKKTESTYNNYKEQRIKVKNMVSEAKNKTWTEFGEKLAKNSKENQKLFYKVLKTLRKGKAVRAVAIKNKEGDLITKTEEIMARWKEHFLELLEGESVHENEKKAENKKEMKENSNKVETRITEEELEMALKKMKNGKSPGHDRITVEMVKKMGEKGKKVLLDLYNKIWTMEEMPSEWEIGQIVPIYKKGDNKQCSNYRGIMLLSVPLKIYEQILEGRLREVIEPTLSEAQSGFRKGRSVQDHIFSLKQIIIRTLEYNKKAFFAFIDLEKAFDKVPREKVWISLEKRGVNSKLQRAIKVIYKNTRNYVISNNERSEEFKTREGLRQGGVLSPVLFTIFMDEIIRKCQTGIRKLHVGYKELKPVFMSECAFADDVVVMAGSASELQTNLLIWKEILTENSMKMNIEKTKVMAVANEPQQMHIQIEGKVIEQVQQFNYLGVIIENTGRQELDITEKIEKSNKLYYAINKTFINKKEVSRKTKMTVYKTIVRPILTYGCESWVMSRRIKARVAASEMKFLRRVKGVSLRDRIRSKQIREELEIEDIMEFIEKRQLSWWGHLQRMKNDRMVKQIWEARLIGRRKRGRPMEKWDSVLGDILERRGKTWNEGKMTARNKNLWREFVYSVRPS